jgi:uncharacterized damage-inducible protein DinB
MSIAQSFIAEMQHEAASTLRLFEALPDNLPDFKPHEKSMTLSLLASHVAELPSWAVETMTLEVMDFAKMDYVPKDFKTKKELIDFHNESVKAGIETLQKCKDEDFFVNWSMQTGDNVHFTLPRAVVMRSFVMNHIVHHRAQMTVYMRMLGIKLPGMYGPTADEQM